MTTLLSPTTPASPPQNLSVPLSLLAPDETEPHVWLLGTSTGICRSADDGQTWEIVSTPVHDIGEVPVFTMTRARRTRTVLAGLDGAVLRSEDGGRTWSLHRLPGPPSVVTRIVTALDDPELALAATAKDGVFVSTDGGSTWAAWNFGLYDLDITDLALPGPSLAVAATETALFASRNGGRSWAEVDPPPHAGTVVRLAASAYNSGGSLLVAGTDRSELWICDPTRFDWHHVEAPRARRGVNDLWVDPLSDPGTASILRASSSELCLVRVAHGGASQVAARCSVPGDISCLGVAVSEKAKTPKVLAGISRGLVLRVREMEADAVWT